MLSERLRAIVWQIADSYYPKRDWAHGLNHIERVLRTAIEIGKQEGADLQVVELAAILHDIYATKERIPLMKDSGTRLKGRRKRGRF